MENRDKWLLGILFGSLFPIIFFFIFFLIWFFYFRNENVYLFVIGGLGSGLISCAFFLKKIIIAGFKIRIPTLILVYLFYNICIYGFFMGFPAVNIIMGIIAGYYFARRIINTQIDPQKYEFLVKRISLFTGFVILLFCTSTAFIVLNHQFMGEELQSMFGLQKEVPKTTIIGIIFTGSIFLVMAEYYLTKAVMLRTLKFSK